MPACRECGQFLFRGKEFRRDSTVTGIPASRQSRSLPWHSGPSKADQISSFVQGADLGYPKILRGLQAGNARKAVVAAQPPRFGEFRGGPFCLAFEAISRGEVATDER